ncbi:tetratricopeptide repeat protein [Streptomyces sp. NPDC102360]|uniref:tetratricopeptide repeat protein n=1 Tax=Streptomyces sp. NPDC102360 TaxID=3366160 RepID=UPI003815F64F
MSELDARALRTLRENCAWDDAERMITERLEAAPEDVPAHVQLVRLRMAQHRNEDALTAVMEAVRIGPRDDEAWAWHVAVLDRLTHWTDAAETGEEALGRGNAGDLTRIALARLHSGRRRPDAALGLLTAVGPGTPLEARARVCRLRTLVRYRRYDKAEAEARTALLAHPDDARTVAVAGWALAWCRPATCTEGLAAIERALRMAPADARVLAARCEALFTHARWDAMRRAAEEAVERRPDVPGLYVHLVRACRGTRHLDRAREALARACALDRDDEDVLAEHLRNLTADCAWDAAAETARRAIERYPRSARMRCELGYLRWAEEEKAAALDAFEQALDADPRYVPAMEWRAHVLRDLNRHEAAETALAEYLGIAPGAAGLHVSRAKLLLHRGAREEALAAVTEALRWDRRSSFALASRIWLLRGLFRWEEAEEAARAYVATYPDKADPLLRLGSVLDLRGREEAALAAYDAAVDTEPGLLEASASRVTQLRSLGRTEAAHEAAAGLVDRWPDAPDAHLAMALLLTDEGRVDEADRALDTALRLAPQHTGALVGRVRLLCNACRWQEAGAAAAQAETRQPRSLPVLFARSHLLLAQGRTREALGVIERADAIDPHDSGAARRRLHLLCEERRFREAGEFAGRMLRLRPWDLELKLRWSAVLQSQQRHSAALEAVEEVLSVQPDFVQARCLRVTLLCRTGRYEEAEDAAREGLDAYSGRTELRARLQLADVLDRLHRYREALVEWERIRAQHPWSVRAVCGMSATLRALHCFDEARHMVTEALDRFPHNDDLCTELALICHGMGLLGEAEQEFEALADRAPNPRLEAAARRGLGWVAVADGRCIDAVSQFVRARRLRPHDRQHTAGQAWAQLCEGTETALDDAVGLCHEVLSERGLAEGLAHTCLGFVAHRRRRPEAAERHFTRATDLEPYDGCHGDLGALYVQQGRYEEAEPRLHRAVELNAYDAAAHIELGNLYLHRADGHSCAPTAGPGDAERAERAFDRALHIDPHSGRAAIGLALALAHAQGQGNLVAAESVLRQALERSLAGDVRAQVHLALTRLLIQEGDAVQRIEPYEQALQEAELAGTLAAGKSECAYLAGIAEQRRGAQSGDLRVRLLSRRRALAHFRRCLHLEPGHTDAAQAMRLLEEENRITRSSRISTGVLAAVCAVALVTLWVDFLWKHHATAVMVTTLTPLLAGLMAIAFLLPVLSRLKLPGGMEADLSASLQQVSAGPVGEMSLSTSWMSFTAGPVGWLPRLDGWLPHRIGQDTE